MKQFWIATALMALSATGLYAQTPAAKPAPESVHIRSTKEKEIKERWFTIPEKRMEVRKDTATAKTSGLVSKPALRPKATTRQPGKN